jgi:hypothetical protein
MTQKKSSYVILAIIATTSLMLFSHNVASYAQTSSDNSAKSSIDAGISAIKSGDNEGAKKNLYEAEVALEGNPNSVGAEKHVEAALKALKDGDTKGVVFHAEEAKKGLP